MESKKTTTSSSKLNSDNRGYQVLEWGRGWANWKWGEGKPYSGQIEIRKPGVAILLSDKIYFKRKTTTNDKKKRTVHKDKSIQQEEVTIENIDAANMKRKC